MSDTNTQWFEEASVGLFVHWGLSAVDGTVEISWGMVGEKSFETDVAADIPTGELRPEEYFSLAEEFDPGNWQPDEWIAAARRAGVEYAVLTTKHHDGFALWPSTYGEFSTRQHLDGRDLVGEFVEACRRQGMRVGFYFSLPDWHHPDFPRPETLSDLRESNPEGMGPDAHERRLANDYTAPPVDRPVLEDAEELVRFERYYRDTKGQLGELLTRYGDIDLLWFDLPIWPETLDHRMESLYGFARETQPHLVINGRVHGYDELGDYSTPENMLPEEPLDGPWELCQIWSPPAWTYHVEERYRDIEWTVRRIVETVSRGGNILLNVGPRPDGSLPEEGYDRLSELETWMQRHGHTVRDVDAEPWPRRADVPVTRNEGVWYLHVLAENGDDDSEERENPEQVTVREVPEPTDVRLVRTGEKLSYQQSGDGIRIDTPERDAASEVIAVSWSPSQHHLL